jgi:glycine/D-amino acid oxidase-like deaminating enzyme
VVLAEKVRLARFPISPLLDRFLQLSHHGTCKVVVVEKNALLQAAAGRRRAGALRVSLSFPLLVVNLQETKASEREKAGLDRAK